MLFLKLGEVEFLWKLISLFGLLFLGVECVVSVCIYLFYLAIFLIFYLWSEGLTSLRISGLMILKAYLQFGQHTFWNKSAGFKAALSGDLTGDFDLEVF